MQTARIAVALLVLTACGKKTAPDAPPPDAPRIELDYRGVTVDGALVAAPGDLETTKLATVPKLLASLGDARARWVAAHPGQTFPGVIDIDAAPEADALAGEGVIVTALAAGYTRVRLKVEEVAVDAPLTVPRSDAAKHRDVRLRLRRAIVGWEIDALVMGPCGAAPAVKARVVRSDGLAAIADEMCRDAERCLLSVEASPGALATVAKLVAPAFTAARPTNVSLAFVADETAAVPDAPAPAPPASAIAPKKAAKVTLGAPEVIGRLASDAVDRGLRASLDGVRACYDAELRRAPAAKGRVVVKLAIDASGAVAEACDAGSSLPSDALIACILHATKASSFAAPEAGTVTVTAPFVLGP